MNEYQVDENRYDGRMQYRRCGQTGLKLPKLSLGHWHNFGGDQPTENQKKMVYTAFDAGITHFDLANNYGPPPGSAEINVGKILKHLPRDEFVVSSKAGYLMWPGPYGEWGSRKSLMASLNQSLKRIDVDYVDIFYSHRFDPDTPLEETMGALNSMVEQGKALYVGVSSYSSDQTQQAIDICKTNGWARPIINQPNYSMFNRWIEKRLTQTCDQNGMGMIAFCPLYQGLLTNKYLESVPENSRAKYAPQFLRSEDMSPKTMATLTRLGGIAKSRGQSLAQMAIAWILRLPEITSVLMGASRPEQITENCQALQNLEFSSDELTTIDKLVQEADLPTSLWYQELE